MNDKNVDSQNYPVEKSPQQVRKSSPSKSPIKKLSARSSKSSIAERLMEKLDQRRSGNSKENATARKLENVQLPKQLKVSPNEADQFLHPATELEHAGITNVFADARNTTPFSHSPTLQKLERGLSKVSNALASPSGVVRKRSGNKSSRKNTRDSGDLDLVLVTGERIDEESLDSSVLKSKKLSDTSTNIQKLSFKNEENIYHQEAKALIRRFGFSGKGHPQILMRSLYTFLQACTTVLLVANYLDFNHKVVLLVCQVVNFISLFHQYKTNKSWNFLIRAFMDVIKVLNLFHMGLCGRRDFFAFLYNDVERENALDFVRNKRPGYPESLDDYSAVCFGMPFGHFQAPELTSDEKAFLYSIRTTHFCSMICELFYAVDLTCHYFFPSFGVVTADVELHELELINGVSPTTFVNETYGSTNRTNIPETKAKLVSPDGSPVSKVTSDISNAARPKTNSKKSKKPPPKKSITQLLILQTAGNSPENLVPENKPKVLLRGTWWLRGRMYLALARALIHCTQGCLKIWVVPYGSYWRRDGVEIVAHFIRGGLLRPATAASLWRQWRHPQ